MEINDVLNQLKGMFGDKLDVAKITPMLKSIDLNKVPFNEIVAKVTQMGGVIGDLDGDGKVESPIEEIKGKAASLFGGLFKK